MFIYHNLKKDYDKLKPFCKSGPRQYFAKLTNDLSICLVEKCYAHIKTGGGSTSGLSRHLSRVHQIDASKNTIQNRSNQEDISSYTISPIFDNSFENDLVRLVVCDLLAPHLITKSQTLRKWAKKAWNEDIPSSPHTIMKHVKNCYEKTFERIKQTLAKSKTFPTLTSDEWTSKNGKRYMNINIHISDQRFSLGLARIENSANAANLSILLNEEVMKICSEQKIFFITTDGASVMKAMSNRLTLQNQPCFLHGINLAICDVFYTKCTKKTDECETMIDPSKTEDDAIDFEQANVEDYVENNELNEILTKIRTLMKFYKYGKNLDELQSIVKADQNKEILPQLDCKTRWVSILPMLKKMVLLEKYMKLHRIQNNLEFPLNNADMERVAELINILAPIEKAVKEIGKENANLNVADIAMTECINSIPENELGNKTKSTLIKRYTERRQIYSDILWHCSGMEEICSTSNIFYAPPSELQIERVTEMLGLEGNIPSANALEVARDPKKFKKESKQDFIASQLLNIRPSSISCERAFSTCARILLPLRGRLLPFNFNMILFLNENFKNIL